ncbi:hypothetical protein [Methylobacterium indicum]|uniref:hypothetical protein n=1 Tax=Methylobacterium indicum TaxID=1775910 RepID=UPI001A921F73|nr:hypothetical protein [Methylobacterium indicum]
MRMTLLRLADNSEATLPMPSDSHSTARDFVQRQIEKRFGKAYATSTDAPRGATLGGRWTPDDRARPRSHAARALLGGRDGVTNHILMPRELVIGGGSRFRLPALVRSLGGRRISS